jgi:hypothetical protein
VLVTFFAIFREPSPSISDGQATPMSGPDVGWTLGSAPLGVWIGLVAGLHFAGTAFDLPVLQDHVH